MEHLLLKAATTATTDQGEFEAVISTASIDRDGDIVEPRAIVKALTKWVPLGKMMPLAYSHRDPATGQAVVVGHIEPASARVEGNEVIAKGWVDQSTERGAETWRLVKSGTLSFSYGYLVPEGGATKRAGKKTGYHITELDLYEVSVVPVGPANNDTRVIGWKAHIEDLEESPRAADELLTEAKRVEREAEEARLPDVPAAPPVQPDPEIDLVKELQEVKARLAESEKAVEDLKKKAEETDREPRARSVDPLRKQAEAVALEMASGGESLRKPPPTSTPKPPELVPLGELKQRMRDQMLVLLSEGIPE